MTSVLLRREKCQVKTEIHEGEDGHVTMKEEMEGTHTLEPKNAKHRQELGRVKRKFCPESKGVWSR